MHVEINLHLQLFYPAEFTENLTGIITWLYGDFGVDGDSFRENVDAEDNEDKQYSASDFRFSFLNHG